MRLLLPILCLGAASLPAQSELYRLDGLTPGDEYGAALEVIEDVDGDGVKDLMVGGRKHQLNGVDSGVVIVSSGADGAELYRIYGLTTREGFGISLDGTGDLNGDGVTDLVVGVVGEMAHGFQSGAIRTFDGTTGAFLAEYRGDSDFWFQGISVACAGDVDGDGTADLITGAYRAPVVGTDAGLARVYSGANGTILHEVLGDAAFDLFGQAVTDCGDLNGDGFDEFGVAAPFHDAAGSDAGQVKIFDGQTGAVLYEWLGNDPGGSFGYALETVGDADADGIPDIAVGANFNDTVNGGETGEVFLFSGATGTLIWSAVGDAPGDRLGESVNAAGDFNADGFDDLLIGAPESDTYATRGGLAQVRSGLDGSVLLELPGSGIDDLFGTFVSGNADFDGDGTLDMVVGAPWEDFPGSLGGSAYVYSLGSLGLALDDPSPGTAGQINQFTVRGATPLASVQFAWGLAPGATATGCGVDWGIANARNGGTVTANMAGTAVLSGNVPGGASGRTLRLQALDLASCSVTNLVTWTF